MFKRNITLGFMLLWAVAAPAQRFDLTARVNFISNSDKNRQQEAITGSTNDKNYENKFFSGGIVAEKTNTKNIVYRLRAGMEREYLKSTLEYDIANNGIRNTSEKDLRIFKFAVGIGKHYDFDYKRIFFKIGVELPFFVGTPVHNNTLMEDYDAGGQLTQTTNIYYDEPSRYYIGINAFANLYYKFWKSFYIGAELANGFIYSKSKGKYDVTYEYYDGSGKLTSTDIVTEELNWSTLSTSFFNPYIGISYRF